MREWLRSQCCKLSVQFSSVQSLSCVWLIVTPWTQHPRPPCPSPSPGVCSNSCPLVSDAIQPSHPLSAPSPGLSQWVSYRLRRTGWADSILKMKETPSYIPSELWTMFLVAMGITYQPNWPPRLIKTRFYPKISRHQKECDHPLCSQSPLNSLWHALV